MPVAAQYPRYAYRRIRTFLRLEPMKHAFAIAAVLNVMPCMLLHAEQAGKPARGQGIRTAEATMQPLSEQVRPDDQRLVLEINASPPLLVRPRGEVLEFLTDLADVVLVVRVVSMRPQAPSGGLHRNRRLAAAMCHLARCSKTASFSQVPARCTRKKTSRQCGGSCGIRIISSETKLNGSRCRSFGSI
jgi:hypothetical protein